MILDASASNRVVTVVGWSLRSGMTPIAKIMVARALFLAAAAAASALASPAAPIALDVSQLAQAFEGIGALSGGGGVTRLLIDYPAALQQDIYDILFAPKAGASLQISA